MVLERGRPSPAGWVSVRRDARANPDKDQAICGAQPESGGRSARRDEELLAEKCYFTFATNKILRQTSEEQYAQIAARRAAWLIDFSSVCCFRIA